MAKEPNPPIVEHPVEEPSVFTAAWLMEGFPHIRSVPAGVVTSVYMLEFDGYLTGWLVAEGMATRFSSGACFHTTKYTLELEGVRCGIVARTIGAPYEVLIAEQLLEAGVRIIKLVQIRAGEYIGLCVN